VKVFRSLTTTNSGYSHQVVSFDGREIHPPSPHRFEVQNLLHVKAMVYNTQ